MRFSFTEEQLVLRDAVTAVLADWCTPGDLHELYANDAPDAGRSHPRWHSTSLKSTEASASMTVN